MGRKSNKRDEKGAQEAGGGSRTGTKKGGQEKIGKFEQGVPSGNNRIKEPDTATRTAENTGITWSIKRRRRRDRRQEKKREGRKKKEKGRGKHVVEGARMAGSRGHGGGNERNETEEENKSDKYRTV